MQNAKKWIRKVSKIIKVAINELGKIMILLIGVFKILEELIQQLFSLF